MTPGPAMRTASELPRKSPVPIAPPMAIMLSWPVVSWRESCSPCSMPRPAASLVFIRNAGTAGRVERAQQLNGGVPGILYAVPDAGRKVDAAARVEFTLFFIHMHDSAAFQNENDFLVGVVMERRFAGRNPSGELSDLPAPEIGVDKITEDAIFAGPNILTLVFVHHESAGVPGTSAGGARQPGARNLPGNTR